VHSLAVSYIHGREPRLAALQQQLADGNSPCPERDYNPFSSTSSTL